MGWLEGGSEQGWNGDCHRKTLKNQAPARFCKWGWGAISGHYYTNDQSWTTSAGLTSVFAELLKTRKISQMFPKSWTSASWWLSPIWRTVLKWFDSQRRVVLGVAVSLPLLAVLSLFFVVLLYSLRWLCVFFLCAVRSLLGSAYFIYTYRKIYTQYIHTYIINLKYI